MCAGEDFVFAYVVLRHGDVLEGDWRLRAAQPNQDRVAARVAGRNDEVPVAGPQTDGDARRVGGGVIVVCGERDIPRGTEFSSHIVLELLDAGQRADNAALKREIARLGRVATDAVRCWTVASRT